MGIVKVRKCRSWRISDVWNCPDLHFDFLTRAPLPAAGEEAHTKTACDGHDIQRFSSTGVELFCLADPARREAVSLLGEAR